MRHMNSAQIILRPDFQVRARLYELITKYYYFVRGSHHVVALFPG